jgi:hypothetical protein
VDFDERQHYQFFLPCEEPVVTSDTFLAMTENAALCHVFVGTVFQLGEALSL